MKVCLVHNAYEKLSGEEAAVAGLHDALTRHGHMVTSFFRNSTDLERRHLGKIGAFFTGIYNLAARHEFSRLLDASRPDLVHVNNLFPQISPSILDETRARGIPVVMTVHNYRLLCPTGLLMSRGELCHRCIGGQEYWCVIRNCTGEWPKSVGYAVRNAVARVRRSFVEGIERFIAPSQFLKSMLIRYGYPAERIDVIRYLVNLDSDQECDKAGEYVGYVGRISAEKGIDTIVDAARRCSDIPFQLAGHSLQMPNIRDKAPTNCRFLGEIASSEVGRFVSAARFTVVSSRWYEISPLSMVDAMLRARAVICSRLGGLTEFVEDGVTGLFFEPGDSHDLAEKIHFLWERPLLCREMGAAARMKALAMFSPEDNFQRLIETYLVATDGICAR